MQGTAVRPRPDSAATGLLRDYFETSRKIKQLNEHRDEIKQAAIGVLAALGGVAELDGECDSHLRFTISRPDKTEIDLVVLKEHTSPQLFSALTKRVHDLDRVRAALELGKLSEEARRAVRVVPDTPRIVITESLAVQRAS